MVRGAGGGGGGARGGRRASSAREVLFTGGAGHARESGRLVGTPSVRGAASLGGTGSRTAAPEDRTGLRTWAVRGVDAAHQASGLSELEPVLPPPIPSLEKLREFSAVHVTYSVSVISRELSDAQKLNGDP